jgi:hypothetical protein
MPGRCWFLTGAAYRNRTDDLRITRGPLSCTDGMTCTDSTPDGTHSADCTGISLRPVPRLVPRPSRRPSLPAGNISASFASRGAMPSVRPGVPPSARGREDCGPSASGRWVMSHTTRVSPVPNGLQWPR